MRRIPDEIVASILSKVDILDVVSSYVTLRRSGQQYVGLCPFHNERTPSFYVRPSKQVYFCHGCGAGGTVVDFLQRLESWTFVEVMRDLAQRTNVHLPDMEEDEASEAETLRRQEMLRAHDLAAKYYNYLLMNERVGAQALQYLLERGVERATIQEFMLGVAPDYPDVLLRFLRKRGLDDELLVACGLVTSRTDGSKLDRFRSRMMIPIHDGQGRVVAFGGRTLTGSEPKYLNSAESPLFHKGRQLFNLHRARTDMRRSGKGVLVEGYMDVIIAYQYGIHGAVAALGTALTLEQAGIIKRNVDEIVLAYDGDTAGQRATLRNGSVCLQAGLRVNVVRLPQGQDPDELLRESGLDAWERQLREAESLVRYALRNESEKADTSSPDGRLRLLEESLALVARFVSSPMERETLLRELADEHHLQLETLQQELEIIAKKHGVGDKANVPWDTVRDIDTIRKRRAPTLPPHAEAERKLLTYMLSDAGVTKQVRNRIGSQFIEAAHRSIAEELYRFYEGRTVPEPAAFLALLSDRDLRDIVAEMMLAMDEEPVSKGLVDESIQHVELLQARRRYDVLEREMIACGDRGDFAEMARLKDQLDQMRVELDAMRRR